MSNATMSNVSIDATEVIDVSATNKTAIHEQAIAEIVGMIRAKYTEDGERNFAIGKRAFEHAQWQKGNVASDYTNSDFDNLMTRIRDDVRYFVPIKAESIRIAVWVRCHVLRELVRQHAGNDVADSLTHHEYAALTGKALRFVPRDVEGTLVEGWLDTIKGIASDRSKGLAVIREDFENRMVATTQRIEAARLASLSPEKQAAKLASDSVRASHSAIAKATKDITTSLDQGIATNVVSPESALSILEAVAKAHGKPLASNAIGFNPADCTIEDCNALALAMFANGKYHEMKALVAKLQAGLAKMDKAMNATKTESVAA